ncbi:uncharacterized protein LOC144506058 [Mustelus asterias]
MGFIHHAAALLALNMNGLLTVLSCVNEPSRNATLGENIFLNPNYTDCETCSIEWTFSSDSGSRRISSFIKKGLNSGTIFGAFKHRVNIENDGFYLRLPSVHFNDTGKYTRTFADLSGVETCVSIVVNVYTESKKEETSEINQSNPEVNHSRTITYISVSIIGTIFGVIILVLITWIVKKFTRKATLSENRTSPSIQMTTYPIYGNWKNRRGVWTCTKAAALETAAVTESHRVSRAWFSSVNMGSQVMNPVLLEFDLNEPAEFLLKGRVKKILDNVSDDATCQNVTNDEGID